MGDDSSLDECASSDVISAAIEEVVRQMNVEAKASAKEKFGREVSKTIAKLTLFNETDESKRDQIVTLTTEEVDALFGTSGRSGRSRMSHLLGIKILERGEARPRDSVVIGEILRSIALVLPAAERDRYVEEFRAEITGLSLWRQVRICGSLMRGVFAIRAASAGTNREGLPKSNN